ncbi:MAG TPA: TMEM175 family protein [Chitinophagaceae bacterium]|jgi:uncharacterized membrane protein
MFRQSVAKKIQSSNKEFRLRGHEVKRIEAFSDAVFAFAVTLLIVSLEVPRSFEELIINMRGFFAFSICFLFLMLIWYEQNVFFRRYGLHDVVTITLNAILIFLVLFYVYPLKFLFTLMFSDQIYGAGNSPFRITSNDVPELMVVYGMGFILIYLVFFLMYNHALRKKEELELTPAEQFDTRTKMFAHIILIAVGILSVVMSQLLPSQMAGSSGFTYFLIGPAFYFFYSIREQRKKKAL